METYNINHEGYILCPNCESAEFSYRRTHVTSNVRCQINPNDKIVEMHYDEEELADTPETVADFVCIQCGECLEPLKLDQDGNHLSDFMNYDFENADI